MEIDIYNPLHRELIILNAPKHGNSTTFKLKMQANYGFIKPVTHFLIIKKSLY